MNFIRELEEECLREARMFHGDWLYIRTILLMTRMKIRKMAFRAKNARKKGVDTQLDLRYNAQAVGERGQ